MDNRTTKRMVKAADVLKQDFPADALEDLLGQYEDAEAELQDKIDRMEEVENPRDSTLERLDLYNERMEKLIAAKEALETMRDAFQELDDALQELGETAE